MKPIPLDQKTQQDLDRIQRAADKDKTVIQLATIILDEFPPEDFRHQIARVALSSVAAKQTKN